MARETPDKIIVRLFNRAMTVEKGVLAHAVNIDSRDVPGDLGGGSLFVPRDDPYFTDEDGNSILSGDIIRCDQGDTPGFPWVIQTADEADVEVGGKAKRGWQIAGAGTFVKWAQALIWPPLGVGRALYATTRWWNWAAPELDVSAWDDAVATEKALVGENFGFPDLFPDADAYWIWDREVGGGIFTGDTAPIGDVYFATTFEKDAYGYVECWGAADDAFELWIDDVPILRDEGFYRGQTQAKKFALDAGDHHIAIKGTNQNVAKAGVLATVIELNPDGTFGDIICRTDETWKALGYPSSPPGFTATKVIRILLAEAQARGALDGCDVGFTDTEFSDESTAPEVAEIAAPIKSSVYSLIRQMQETDLEATMRQDALTLDLWPFADAGTDLTATVVFGRPSGDIDADQLQTIQHRLDNVFELAP